MKFLITRISARDDKVKPCDEAFIEKVTYIDFRTVSTLKEAEKYQWFKRWYESGTNHREENGMIACDSFKKKEQWCIDINSLDDLLKFIGKYGDVIMGKSDYKEISMSIEIYDDYRE